MFVRGVVEWLTCQRAFERLCETRLDSVIEVKYSELISDGDNGLVRELIEKKIGIKIDDDTYHRMVSKPRN